MFSIVGIWRRYRYLMCVISEDTLSLVRETIAWRLLLSLLVSLRPIVPSFIDTNQTFPCFLWETSRAALQALEILLVHLHLVVVVELEILVVCQTKGLDRDTFGLPEPRRYLQVIGRASFIVVRFLATDRRNND